MSRKRTGGRRTAQHGPVVNPIRVPEEGVVEREGVGALAAAEDAAWVVSARGVAGCEDGVGDGGGGGVDGGVSSGGGGLGQVAAGEGVRVYALAAWVEAGYEVGDKGG